MSLAGSVGSVSGVEVATSGVEVEITDIGWGRGHGYWRSRGSGLAQLSAESVAGDALDAVGCGGAEFVCCSCLRRLAGRVPSGSVRERTTSSVVRLHLNLMAHPAAQHGIFRHA